VNYQYDNWYITFTQTDNTEDQYEYGNKYKNKNLTITMSIMKFISN